MVVSGHHSPCNTTNSSQSSPAQSSTASTRHHSLSTDECDREHVVPAAAIHVMQHTQSIADESPLCAISELVERSMLRDVRSTTSATRVRQENCQHPEIFTSVANGFMSDPNNDEQSCLTTPQHCHEMDSEPALPTGSTAEDSVDSCGQRPSCNVQGNEHSLSLDCSDEKESSTTGPTDQQKDKTNSKNQRRRSLEASEHPYMALCQQLTTIYKNEFMDYFPWTQLTSGSVFRGQQKSRGNCYDVEVELRLVDYRRSTVCGFLQIANLTEVHPILTTYFEGEIIGPRYKFITRKWGATPDVDRMHWSRFSAFQPFEGAFKSRHYDYSQLQSSNVIFMRWKEQYALPDWWADEQPSSNAPRADTHPGSSSHGRSANDDDQSFIGNTGLVSGSIDDNRDSQLTNDSEETLAGASLAGFYYIQYSKENQSIEGYYYHRNSEWYQTIQLNRVEDRPGFRIFGPT